MLCEVTKLLSRQSKMHSLFCMMIQPKCRPSLCHAVASHAALHYYLAVHCLLMSKLVALCRCTIHAYLVCCCLSIALDPLIFFDILCFMLNLICS